MFQSFKVSMLRRSRLFHALGCFNVSVFYARWAVSMFQCFTPVGLFQFFAFLGGCRSFHSVGKTLRAEAKIGFAIASRIVAKALVYENRQKSLTSCCQTESM